MNLCGVYNNARVDDLDVTVSEFEEVIWGEKIYIASEDDSVAEFEEEMFLLSVVGEWSFGSVEHVGSTAVPGMVAKPVIDVICGVKSLEESRPAINVLVEHGYEYWPYKTEFIH